MSLQSLLRFADFIATVAVDSAVLVFALTAYRRTNMRAFAFLFWGSAIGIIISVGMQLERRTFHTASDAVGFWELYRAGYIVCSVLWGVGIVSLIRHVLSRLESKEPIVA